MPAPPLSGSQGTPGPTSASTTAHPEPPAGSPKMADQVSAALGLGRQMAELYVAVGDRFADPATASTPHHLRHGHPPPPALLAGLGPLDDQARFRLRLLAVQAALHRIRDTAADAGLVMPDADDLIAQPDQLFGPSGCATVAALHAQIVEILSASVPPMGSAYELGSALAGLCEATCKNAAEFQGAINSGRIDRIRDLINRLGTVLPPHAARAVVGALNNWDDWLRAGKVGTQAIDWDRDGPVIAQALNAQGALWFSVLNGQKAAVDLLSIDSYVTAGEGMVRQYRRLGQRFVAQWWPGLAGGAAAVIVLAVLFLRYGHGAIQGFGPLITVLAGVGVTAKTATATLEKTAADIGNSLWQAELDDAIILAATSLPAGAAPVAPAVSRPLQYKQRMVARQARDARHQAIAQRAKDRGGR